MKAKWFFKNIYKMNKYQPDQLRKKEDTNKQYLERTGSTDYTSYIGKLTIREYCAHLLCL